MTRFLRLILVAVALCALASCNTSKFKTYRGPTVTLVEVHKSDRKMFLMHGTKILKAYDIHLGGNPIGPKQFEGDGKTPEGAYYISHRNPNSSYHLSLGVSYPNEADIAFAKLNKLQPGNNIFVHGGPPHKMANDDWTVGCIAVTDKEMEDIYAMVNPGTPINIFP
ncbi:MAG: L,D-transpeptidase family protein [Paracoccaceae bacterium]